LTVPSLPSDVAVTITQLDHREVFWSVPSAGLISSFSEDLPFSLGFNGGSASEEKGLKYPVLSPSGQTVLLGTERGLWDAVVAARNVPSQKETHCFCSVTTKLMMVIVQIFGIFQDLGG